LLTPQEILRDTGQVRSLVCTLLLVATIAGLGGQGAARAQAASASGFAVVHGTSFIGQLRAVSARTPTDVWAVGGRTVSLNRLHPYAEHWNGRSWSGTPVPVPPDAGDAFFESVSAVSANDVWAAGFASFPGRNGGFVEHWDGTGWSLLTQPDGGFVLALSPTNVWVLNGLTSYAEPQHWNGSSWKTITSPSVDGAPVSLFTATGRPGDLWFSGSASHDAEVWPEMVHWNGSTWAAVQEQPVPAPNTRAVIQGLSMAATGRVYGVGFTDEMQGADVFHLYGRIYGGGTWSAAPFTQFPTDHELRAVAATGDGAAWAVGQRYSPYGARTLIEQWDDETHRWIDLGGPNPGSSFNLLTGVAAVGGTRSAAYAAGWFVDGAGVQHPILLHHG
jgi:hypothetical protein